MAVVAGDGKLGIKKIAEPTLQKGHVMLRQTTFGLNFADIELLYGKAPNANPDGAIGFEAVGIIEDISSECMRGFKIGQRVCYATYHIPGAFSERRSVPEQFLIPIDDEISDDIAATTLKGLTAQMLLFRVYRSKVGNAIAVGSATSAVGIYFSQWASNLGINVLALIGSDTKKQAALNNGARAVCNYKTMDPKEIVKIARSISENKMGLNAVYDGIGAALFPLSLALLAPLGILINYGNVSGEITRFQPQMLDKKALFFTRPSVYIYKAYIPELVISASEFYYAILNSKITPRITKYESKNLGQAFSDLKSGKIVGQKVFAF